MEAREAVSMKARVAEEELGDPSAFHVEADVLFVRHADPAMHLDAFFAGIAEGVRESCLARGAQECGLRVTGVVGAQRLQNDRLGELDLAEPARRPVLHCRQTR